ncbi:MAG TPA: HlyD family secretion protein [Roseiarcus sp.]|jgi:RND family efflux transporter MFP subunit
MSGVELKASDVGVAQAIKSRPVLSSLHVLPFLITAIIVCAAAAAGWGAWQYYMGTPWTRDGAVRAYVVKIAPQVAGEIVKLPIADNQFVHKGELLMLIDPRNYSIAVRQAQAAVEQAKAVADNANAEMSRRLHLNDVAVTMEERQTYISQAATAEAAYQTALANLELARVNYQRTRVRSPVNGYVTNLSAQLGNYAEVGSLQLSVVNSDSYWVDAYFEETALSRIHEGDAATIKLMGYTPLLRGRVQGLARGINVPNSTPDASGLASVNPIFTFVRLAQRVPVRIHIDEVPEGVKLVAGMTATVQIEPNTAPPAANSKPASAEVSETRAPSSQTLAEVARLGAPLTTAPAQTSPQTVAPAAAPSPAQPPVHERVVTPSPRLPVAQGVSSSSAPAASSDQLSVPLPPSPQATAAADAASADLKTLQEQIAANPPAGAASAPTAGNPGGRAVADATGPSDYLGQTYDLFGDQGAAPAPRRGSPGSLRRRAHPRWRWLPRTSR